MSGGNPWTARQVLATLSNPIYLGKITDGDRLRDRVHKALVPEALFAEVRSRIEARRTRRNWEKGFGKVSAYQAWFPANRLNPG